jgi:hypothetical protein
VPTLVGTSRIGVFRDLRDGRFRRVQWRKSTHGCAFVFSITLRFASRRQIMSAIRI